MQGILLIDKPIGWTSFDVVHYVRRIVASVQGTKPKNTKVGHSGTLDPLASGLLIIFIGKEYTRQASLFLKQDKVYSATARLGFTSSTGDEEGVKRAINTNVPTLSHVQQALTTFVGESLQTPPQYSALKVNGVRAYESARRGEVVVLAPRPITIHSLALDSYDYPFVRFLAHVSSGTYIRSLVQDIGESLGTGAYMSDLTRTSIGTYLLQDAVQPEDIAANNIESLLRLTETT